MKIKNWIFDAKSVIEMEIHEKISEQNICFDFVFCWAHFVLFFIFITHRFGNIFVHTCLEKVPLSTDLRRFDRRAHPCLRTAAHCYLPASASAAFGSTWRSCSIFAAFRSDHRQQFDNFFVFISNKSCPKPLPHVQEFMNDPICRNNNARIPYDEDQVNYFQNPFTEHVSTGFASPLGMWCNFDVSRFLITQNSVLILEYHDRAIVGGQENGNKIKKSRVARKKKR